MIDTKKVKNYGKYEGWVSEVQNHFLLKIPITPNRQLWLLDHKEKTVMSKDGSVVNVLHWLSY